MNIISAIGMFLNSNLNKPLDITLNEIQTSVNKVRKATRHIKNVVGIPYNATDNSQVLSLSDAPIFSIEGTGRILQIIPLISVSSSSTRSGTVYFTVDDEVILNNAVRYAYGASDKSGNFIVTNYFNPDGAISITNDMFEDNRTYYFNISRILRTTEETVNRFSTSMGGIVEPNGIPFKNKFELRMTQNIGTTIENAGVTVVYELYE